MEPVTTAALIAAAAASIGGGVAAGTRKGFRPGFQWGQSGERKRDRNGNLMAGDVDGYNADKYEYGGQAGAADARAGMYDGLAHGAALREGAQADYGAANADRAQAQQARAQQAQALDLQRQAALGTAPSVAQLQMQAGMDQAMRGQEAQRASARGAAGVAMADYGAAANIAATQQQTNQQMGILRAQEMATARDAYMQGATGMRGMDYQAAQQAAAMAQFQTEQEMRQREMNDRQQMGMYGMAEGVRGLQMQGNLQQQSAMANAYFENKRLEQAAAAGQAAQAQQAIQMGVGGLVGASSAIMSAYGPRK
ncbi:MAG: hypothetical protein U0183_01205 [Polyangiaceae bacterium]